MERVLIKNLILIILFLLVATPSEAQVNWCDDAANEGCWPFTEGSGESVEDQSSNSNDGTFKGAGEPAWTAMSGTNAPSYANWSVHFDGGDDEINCGQSDNFAGATTGFTYVLWFNPDVITGSDRNILNKSGLDYLAATDVNGSLVGSIGGDNTEINAHRSDNSVVVVGEWNHLAVIWEGNGGTNWDFYVNGVSKGDTNVFTTGTVDVTRSVSSTPFFLGTTQTDGLLSETAVFSSLLDSTDVNDIMDNGLVQVAGLTGLLLQ